MLSKFQEKFDTFYNDPEFNFKADDRLIAMICASLQYENFDLKDKINMIRYGIVSTSIMLIQEGSIDMYYKNNKEPILVYDEGSYFGEVSLLFKVRNHYRFQICDNV